MPGNAAVHPTKAYKLAVVGIGNELNGDDAAGVRVALRLLSKNRKRRFLDNNLIINAGLGPENFSGVLRRFNPDVVFFVDAAEMGKSAGTVCELDWRNAGGFGPSTHLMPISTLGEYLEAELDCQVKLLGIQPKQLDFDAPLSPEVAAAVEQVVDWITCTLQRNYE
jgi:hydrogenase maturation protease HycI